MGTSTVTQAKIWRAVNTPGGPAFEWARKTSNDAQDRATVTSPVNKPLNALHRGGVVGTLKKSWRRRAYSNQHGSGAVIYSNADHAEYVELGRSLSTKFQLFSWTKFPGEAVYINGRGYLRGVHDISWATVPGSNFIGRKTRARFGKHVLERALRYAGRRNT